MTINRLFVVTSVIISVNQASQIRYQISLNCVVTQITYRQIGTDHMLLILKNMSKVKPDKSLFPMEKTMSQTSCRALTSSGGIYCYSNVRACRTGKGDGGCLSRMNRKMLWHWMVWNTHLYIAPLIRLRWGLEVHDDIGVVHDDGFPSWKLKPLVPAVELDCITVLLLQNGHRQGCCY